MRSERHIEDILGENNKIMLEFCEIDKLQQVAKSLLSDKENDYISDEEKYNEITWNESLFISQMLLNSNRWQHLNKSILDEEIKKYNDENRTSVCKDSIDIKIFDKIHSNFKNIYPNILPKKEIKKLLKLRKTKNQPQYEYESSLFRNFTYCQKILANIWYHITIKDSNFVNCIKKWLILTGQFGTADFISLLGSEEQQNFKENAIKLLQEEKELIPIEQYNQLICEICDYRKSNINDYDYFLMWCNYGKYHSQAKCEFFSQSWKPYLLLLESLLYTKEFKRIKGLLLQREKRPYLFLQLLYSLKNKHPEYLINFIGEDNYGIVFYTAFIEHCFHKIISDQSELLESSTISLLKEVMRLFVDKNLKNPFKYKIFSRLLMWLCGFNSKVETSFSINQKKEEIYHYHITLLKKILSQIPDLVYEKLMDCFRSEKDYILPISYGVGISHFSYLFNILEIARQQKEKDFIPLVVEEITNLYDEKILRCDELCLIYEYKQIEHFDWASFYNEIIAKGKLDEFLNKTLNSFMVSENSTLSNHDLNRTNADRFKLLLKTLCLAYKKISVDNKNELEEKILSLLSHCFTDNKNSKSINIFAPFYESTYIEDVDIALFPLLVDVANSFSKKNQEKFIELVLKGDFRLWFKAYNLITFEEGKKQIENFVKDKSFSEKIDEIFTIPDLIEVLEDITKSDLNKDLESLLFDKLEKNIRKKASKGHLDKEVFNIENLRLFRLFKERNVKALNKYNSYVLPKYNKLLDSEKTFYLALIDLENGMYDHSNNKFYNLIKEYPRNLRYKVYQFYAKSCELSKKEEQKEIKNLINKVSKLLLKEDSYKYKDVLLLTKLRLYIADNDLNNARYFYQLFDPILKKDLESSCLMIEILLKNDMLDDARTIYSDIDPKFQDKEEYKKLTELLSQSMGKKEEDLRNSYKDILVFPNKNRFKVLPECINEHKDNIGTYVLNEIKHALKNTLEKIDLVEKISGSEKKSSEDENSGSEKKLPPEDDITDLLELQINGRLSMLGYKLDNQSRCGKSTSGKNAGEIDLKMDLVDFSIMIEAVKYSSGSKNRKTHIEKIFNYDPSRKYFYNLIYFDSDANFNESWNTVKEEIQKAEYPSDYELKTIEDLDSDNQNIKIARSEHNGGLIYYHIMGNFRYPSSKKKVASEKADQKNKQSKNKRSKTNDHHN